MNKPTKPNIVIPESFAENGIKTDFDNEKLTNGFDRLQPDVLAGDNLNKLIDDTYKASNYALNLGDYVLGKNQITNCILEAPNGVATYSGSTVTVKGGIKVLMPNGLNENGTLKNIEYTLSQDADLVNNDKSLYGCVFLDKDLGLQVASANNVFYQETLNNSGEISTSIHNQYWYKPSENMWYKKLPKTSNWISCNVCPICYPTTSSRGVSSPTTIITNLYNLKPISLKTVDDSDGHWVLKGKTIIAFADNNFPQNYDVTFDLTDHLPNDGYYYEVLLNSYCKTYGYNTMSMTVEGRISQYFYRAHVSSGGTGGHSSGRFLVGSDRRLRIFNDNGYGTSAVQVSLSAYRKVV